jgi:hypothetical protein
MGTPAEPRWAVSVAISDTWRFVGTIQAADEHAARVAAARALRGIFAREFDPARVAVSSARADPGDDGAPA